MKRISNLMLILMAGLVLGSAAYATTVEEAYIASYHGRSDIPVPISVVSPDVSKEFAGTKVVMTFVVETDGMPRDIAAVGKVDPELADVLTEALRDWVFKPALVDGKAVATKVALPIIIHGDATEGALRVASR